MFIHLCHDANQPLRTDDRGIEENPVRRSLVDEKTAAEIVRERHQVDTRLAHHKAIGMFFDFELIAEGLQLTLGVVHT